MLRFSRPLLFARPSLGDFRHALSAGKNLRRMCLSEAPDFDGNDVSAALGTAALRVLSPETILLGEPSLDQMVHPYLHLALQHDTLDTADSGEIVDQDYDKFRDKDRATEQPSVPYYYTFDSSLTRRCLSDGSGAAIFQHDSHIYNSETYGGGSLDLQSAPFMVLSLGQVVSFSTARRVDFDEIDFQQRTADSAAAPIAELPDERFLPEKLHRHVGRFLRQQCAARQPWVSSVWLPHSTTEQESFWDGTAGSAVDLFGRTFPAVRRFLVFGDGVDNDTVSDSHLTKLKWFLPLSRGLLSVQNAHARASKPELLSVLPKIML